MAAIKGRKKKYALDTNLFIKAFREPETNARLIQFHAAFAPFEYLHSIVVQELRAGMRAGKHLRALERHILEPFIRRGRLITPSFAAWKQSGDVLRDLAHQDGLQLSAVPKSFGNDILLAVSCRESGVTLVTDNLRDFNRIHAVLPFEFVEAWPVRSAD